MSRDHQQEQDSVFQQVLLSLNEDFYESHAHLVKVDVEIYEYQCDDRLNNTEQGNRNLLNVLCRTEVVNLPNLNTSMEDQKRNIDQYN